MFKKDFEVSILVNGKSVQEYIKDGKFYIEGRRDTTYSIKIKNNSWRRIVAIPTVDGLSVINGKEASYDSTGYVIGSHDSITIDGWRKNDKEVAQFYFSSSNKSYAAKMKKGKNQGVIGIAVYKEREKEENITNIFHTYPQPIVIEPVQPPKLPNYPVWPNYFTCDNSESINYSSASNCCSLSASSAGEEERCSSKQKIGTGWGETKKSEIVNVSFERDNNSLTVFEFYYNTRSELTKKGINFKNKLVAIEEPSAFPNEYCAPPSS